MFTIVRHAHREALVESAVLALVAVLLLDFAFVFALIILQLQPDGPSEETLVETERHTRSYEDQANCFELKKSTYMLLRYSSPGQTSWRVSISIPTSCLAGQK